MSLVNPDYYRNIFGTKDFHSINLTAKKQIQISYFVFHRIRNLTWVQVFNDRMQIFALTVFKTTNSHVGTNSRII